MDIQSSQKEIRQEMQTNIDRKLDLASCLMELQIAAVTSCLSARERTGEKTDLHCELIIINDSEKRNVKNTQSEGEFRSDRSIQRGHHSAVHTIERPQVWKLCDTR